MLQTLNTTGFLFTEVACEFALLTADYGDGYEDAAVIGSVQGLRTWAMKIDVLPDGTNHAPGIPDTLEPSFLLTESGDYVLTEGGDRIILEHELPRSQYLWKFFRISKAAGNAPFWIEFDDPDDGLRKRWLASFVDHKLSYGVLCAKIYSTGLQLRERRERGVTSPVLVT